MNKSKVENGEVRKKPKYSKEEYKILDTEQGKKIYRLLMNELEGEYWLADVAVSITNALNQQRGELVEKFKEVIGEDEKNLGSHDREGNLDMDDWSIGFRNQLREEQKAKLESF